MTQPQQQPSALVEWLETAPSRLCKHRCPWCGIVLANRDNVYRHMVDSCEAAPQGDFGGGPRQSIAARMLEAKPPIHPPTTEQRGSEARESLQVPQSGQSSRKPHNDPCPNLGGSSRARGPTKTFWQSSSANNSRSTACYNKEYESMIDRTEQRTEDRRTRLWMHC